ncbi:4151_t:CDS:2, partial [Funneliformis mosseae]
KKQAMSGNKVAKQSTLPTKKEVESWNRQELCNFLISKGIEDKEIKIIIDKQKVDGSTFLELTTETLQKWKIPGGPDIKILKLVNEIQGGIKPFTGKVSVLVDNFSLLKQGEKTVRFYERDVDRVKMLVSYKNLQSFILNGRELGGPLEIICSYSSMRKKLVRFWDKIKSQGFVVHPIKKKPIMTREKRVDMQLATRGEQILEERNPGILVIVTGDSGFKPLIRSAMKKGWKVEIWFLSFGIKYFCI